MGYRRERGFCTELQLSSSEFNAWKISMSHVVVSIQLIDEQGEMLSMKEVVSDEIRLPEQPETYWTSWEGEQRRWGERSPGQ